MPIETGEYRPGDLVEANTIYNTILQDPEAAPEIQMSLDDVMPDMPDVTLDVGQLARRDWPTTSVFNWLSETGMPSDPNWEQPFHELPPSHYRYREMYEDADSPMKWHRASQMVEQEILDDKMYSQMGVSEWAQYMGWQMIDPISVLLTIGTAPLMTMGKGVTVGQAAARTYADRTARGQPDRRAARPGGPADRR